MRLGRSEAVLEPWLRRLEGKAEVRVACMDLACAYRSLVRRARPLTLAGSIVSRARDRGDLIA